MSRSRGFPHELAPRDFRRAININPSLVQARWAVSRVYQHAGLLDRAIEELQTAGRLDPKNTRPREAQSFWR